MEPRWWGVLDTALCDKVCQWRVHDKSVVSPGTPVFFTNKTDHHDITEVLLKVALNTINQAINKDLIIIHQCCCFFNMFLDIDTIVYIVLCKGNRHLSYISMDMWRIRTNLYLEDIKYTNVDNIFYVRFHFFLSPCFVINVFINYD